MNGVTFANNSADTGGAIALWGEAHARVQGGVLFLSNAAIGPGPTTKDSGGGAIFITDKAGITLTGNVSFINNSAVSGGGAFDACGTANVTIGDDVRFMQNMARNQSSGALRMRENSTLQITPVTVPVEFQMNVATNSGGGALGLRDSSKGIFDGPVVFVNNTAWNDSGGAVLVQENAQASFKHGVVFYNNSAIGGRAGAVAVVAKMLEDAVMVNISEGVLFLRNSAHKRAAGAIDVCGSAHASIGGGVAFVENSAYGGSGGGIMAEDEARIYVVGHVLFINNTCVNGTGGALCGTKNSAVVISGEDPQSPSELSLSAIVRGSSLDIPWINYFARIMTASSLSGNATELVKTAAALLDERYDTGRGTVRFGGNTALKDSGGAVAMKGNSNLVVKGDVVFENNTANSSLAGALCVSEHARATVSSGVRFIGNIALGFGGGALAALHNSRVAVFDNVSFVRNQVLEGMSEYDSGGAFTVMENATLQIWQGVYFVENSVGKWASGGAGAAMENATLIITGGVHFIKNMSPAHSAGALFVKDSVKINITGGIRGVVFDRNEAGRSGGAVALISEGNGLRVELGNNVSFINNIAGGGGGGAIWIANVPQLIVHDGVRFINNEAGIDGGALRVFNSRVTLQRGVLIHNNTALHLGGGIAAAGNTALHIFGDASNTDATSPDQFADNYARSGGDSLHLDLSSVLEVLNSNLAPDSSSVLKLRNECTLGERLLTGYCQTCPVQMFGLDPHPTDPSSCQVCHLHANCSGGHAVEPYVGYWHSSKHSTQIHHCPRELSCEGGMVCAEGYSGHVCAECDAGYGFGGFFKCSKCMNAGKTLGLYLAAAFVLLLGVALLVQTTLKDNIAGTSSVRPSDLLKLIVRHVQYLVIINSIRMQWPQSLGAIFTAAGWIFTAGGSEVVALACVFDPASKSWGTFSVAVKVLAVYLLAPLGFLAALLVGSAIVGFALTRSPCRAPGHPHPSRTLSASSAVHVLAVSFLVVLFFFYPTYLRSSFSFFACKKLDDVGPLSPDPYKQYAVANATYGYWVPEMHQPCWEGWHKVLALAVGVPSLLLFCLGVPACVGLILYFNRHNIDFRTGSFQACAVRAPV
jgi:predicted outer membrane repeat protein